MHYSLTGLVLLTVGSLMVGAFVIEPLTRQRHGILAWIVLLCYCGVVLALSSRFGAI